jgi:hypothetical protein
MQCSTCKQNKPITDFYRKTETTYRKQCKSCRNAVVARWGKAHPEKIRTVKRNYRIANSETIRIRQAHYRISLHGISCTEKHSLWVQQKKCCALCQRPFACEVLRIDHDHGCVNSDNHRREAKTEYGCRECIRGLLCDLCNGRHLPFLERHLHLQSDAVKQYLCARPFSDAFLSRQTTIV